MMVVLQRFGTDVRDGWATKVDFSGDIHKSLINETKELHCETVIISTGRQLIFRIAIRAEALTLKW
jgi:hypothetical protein